MLWNDDNYVSLNVDWTMDNGHALMSIYLFGVRRTAAAINFSFASTNRKWSGFRRKEREGEREREKKRERERERETPFIATTS